MSVPYVVVAVQPKPEQSTNHILHLILSIITCGAWLPLWFLIAINTGVNNVNIRAYNRKLLQGARQA